MTALHDTLAVLAFVAVIAVVIYLLWLHHMAKRHGTLVLIGRWFAGHSLDGQLRTNATWSEPATKVLHPTGRAHPWHHMRRRNRVAIRVAAGIVLLASGYGLVTATRLTVIVLAAVAVLLLALYVGHVVYKIRFWHHERHYLRPLERSLTARVGAAPETLQIERSGKEIMGVTIEWAPELEIGAEHQDAVLATVNDRLAIEAPEPAWNLKGRNRSVTFTRTQPPPASVPAHEIVAAIRAAKGSEFVLGKGKKSEPLIISADTDTPHVGISMGSNDGKSTAAMNMGTQWLYHGGLLAVLDDKLVSHMWCRGLSNVAYAGTGAEIFALLVWLAWDDENRDSELTRRKKIVLASADIHGNVHADIGPRILIVAEELNSLQKTLKRYWRQIGGKGPNPAAEALEVIHFAGRQLRFHVVDIGQRLSAKATSGSGSGDSRENIGAILFSNPTASTWKMLAEGQPQPPASDHKGRYQLYTRKTVREFQGALWDVEDARKFAMSGTVAVPRDDMPGTDGVQPLVLGVPREHVLANPVADQPEVLGQGPVVPALPGAVTLREAHEGGLFPSVAAARKAVQRARLEPAGVRSGAHLYLLTELAICQKGRIR